MPPMPDRGEGYSTTALTAVAGGQSPSSRQPEMSPPPPEPSPGLGAVKMSCERNHSGEPVGNFFMASLASRRASLSAPFNAAPSASAQETMPIGASRPKAMP